MVTGMTCGSCAARIERRLNQLDGVSATVNYATGRTYFTGLGGRRCRTDRRDQLDRLPGGAARARRRQPRHRPRGQGAGPAARRLRPAGRSRHRAGDGACHPVHRLAVGEPAAGGPGRRLGRLAAAPGRARRTPTPTATDAGQPRGRRILRLGRCTRCCSAARACSACGCRVRGCSMRRPAGRPLYPRDRTQGASPPPCLAGRYLEAREKDHSSSALTALAALGAKTVAVLRGGAEAAECR